MPQTKQKQTKTPTKSSETKNVLKRLMDSIASIRNKTYHQRYYEHLKFSKLLLLGLIQLAAYFLNSITGTQLSPFSCFLSVFWYCSNRVEQL